MKLMQMIISSIMAITLATAGAVELPAPAANAPSFGVTSSDLALEVKFDSAEYTLDTVIGSAVTITNNTDKTMVFVKGSGSNSVPDALKYTIGGFVPLFKPEMMTMDFRMDDLAPGESVTFQCDFAPYIPKDGLPGFGAGRDIEYFKSGDFDPAPLGTTEGSLSFAYFLQETSVSELALYDASALTEKSVNVEDITVVIE
jgi:hypothetical protein